MFLVMFIGVIASLLVPVFGFIILVMFLEDTYRKPFPYIIASIAMFLTHLLITFITLKIVFFDNNEAFDRHIDDFDSILEKMVVFLFIFGICILFFEKNLIKKVISNLHNFMKKWFNNTYTI